MLPSEGIAGGFAVPGGLSSSIQANFLRHVVRLAGETKRLLLRAARRSVIVVVGSDRTRPVARRIGTGGKGGFDRDRNPRAFRHPPLRSAIYRSAAPENRRAAHRALAAATDPEADPDRRAWHRAHATLTPDGDVVDELERSAGRARSREGHVAAAAFLTRATELTPDPTRHVHRALDAAFADVQTGAFRTARPSSLSPATDPRGVATRADRHGGCSVGIRVKPRQRCDTAVAGCRPTPRSTRY
jgi:hypothetical protein